MDHIKKYFSENDKFAQHIGAELIEVKEGYAKVQLKVEPHHFNSANVVHGGAIFTLADFAFAAAANSYGRVALSINANINFIKAATGGVLYAVAEELSNHTKLAIYCIRVFDDGDDLVASFEGLVYKKRGTLPHWDSGPYC